MKRFAIVSVVLLLIALLGVGAMYMTSNVTVIAQGVTALEAYRDYDLFTDLSAQVRAGAVVGTSFVAPQELSSAEDYVFYTYTFRLENNTTLPAEMIEVQITPMSGDILQIGSDQVLTLPAHTIGDVTATILTSKDMHAIREANPNMSLVMVSHDLGVVQHIADRIVVLHDGRVEESGTTMEILKHPCSAYTRSLIEAASMQS